MIAFGPVPSRRLGRSLGINNIPPKNCTYSCRYCQAGRTTNMSLDRPCRKLDLDEILVGMIQFARSFSGQLATETMLVQGLNDGEDDVKPLAEFLKRLKPAKAYLSIPTRPPAEPGICSPDENAVTRAFQIVQNAFPHVEYLTGYEGNAFAASGNLEEDLLNITAVHPLKAEAVRRLARRNQAAWSRVEKLLRQQQLAEIEYAGEKFYTRRWTNPQKGPSAPSK